MDKKLAALRKARERVQKTMIRQVEQCEKKIKALEEQIRDRKAAIDTPFPSPGDDRDERAAVVRDLLHGIELGQRSQNGRWIIGQIAYEMRQSGCSGQEAACRIIQDRVIPTVYWQMLEWVENATTTQERHRAVGQEIIDDLKGDLAACLRALRKEGT